MCGIVGYIGHRSAEPILIDALSRLEYRGYDSAGIATLEITAAKTQTHRQRAAGKLINLKEKLKTYPCAGTMGIGHTRWATHGKPTEANAHPHHSHGITIVHNGIIENHHSLRAELTKQKFHFQSDTDTEVFLHLVEDEKRVTQNFTQAVLHATQRAKGAYALAIIDEQEPNKIICVKQACPLLIGVGESEMFVISDYSAALQYTKRFIILQDGDIAVVTANHVEIMDVNGHAITRPIKTIDWSPLAAEKSGYKHFMLKEIFEQPRAISDTLLERLDYEHRVPSLPDINTTALQNIERISIVACGSSYHAGLLGKYYLETYARIPVDVDLASEYRYRNPIANDRTLVIGISQSGETADTIGALHVAKEKGARLLAVCNVMDSAIPRLCESSVGTLYTKAGPEVSVASTKAFVTQAVALYLLALHFAHAHKTLTSDEMLKKMHDIAHLPVLLEGILKQVDAVKEVAEHYVDYRDMLFLGRGVLFPIALEGALKMKEISYIHAEGYAGGEMKHGPIALISPEMPVVVLASDTEGYDKITSNLEQIKARGGRVIVLCQEHDTHLPGQADHAIKVPYATSALAPLIATLPLQLLSYYMADLRGTDVDQPRNLAKSVTVE